MLFLDCEFNGHKGKLISLALVSDKGGDFYEVLRIDRLYENWVLDNVIPFLNKQPIDEVEFRKKLQDYLTLRTGETIVADSPADFWYLMDYLHEMKNEKYRYINLEIDMKFIISGILYPSTGKYPEIPHNALSDARALMEWYKINRSQV